MKCNNCRFWSERLAMSLGGGPMQAYCLEQTSPHYSTYTVGFQGCDVGKLNTYGAIDTPHEESRIAALYAAEESQEPTK